MEQGRKRLWSLVHTPPRQGSAVQQAISEASTSFWSALHDFARHDRPVPANGWDEVGPDHPFLFICNQVPLRSCGCASPISIDGVLFQCFAWQALHSTRFRGIWFRFVWPRYAFCFALPCLARFVHLTWLVVWLSCLPCRIWCKIIIIIKKIRLAFLRKTVAVGLRDCNLRA
jgi:hypothetical protein